MPASNPLTAIDNLVADAILDHPLFANMPPESFQVFDRPIDARGDVEGAIDLGKRIWIEPQRSDVTLDYSSGSTRFVRRWLVSFGNDSMAVEEIRMLEWKLIQALTRLYNLTHADGSPILASETFPLTIQAIKPGGSQPERNPLADTEAWVDEIHVTAELFASTADV
jgi:hypothetical protein